MKFTDMAEETKEQGKELTPQQRLFVLEYLKDLNATQAAVRAGYSEKTARQIGSRLLANVDISAAVEAGMKKRANKLEITAERVLAELAKLAFFDARKLFDENGQPVPITQLDDDTAAAVVGLDVYEEKDEGVVVGYTKKIKLADKKGALVDLGRHLKLFTDVVEVKDDSGLAARMDKARKRAKGKE